MFRRVATLAGLVFLALCVLGVSSAASPPRPGSLDSSFGSGGVVTYGTGDPYSTISGIAVQPDRKIVAFGNAGPDLVLVRYLPNGSPDPSFGTGGYVKTTVGGHVNAMALQPDGKIVVAGFRFLDRFPVYSEFIVARYNPGGSLDTSFGTDGVVTTDVGVGSCCGRYEDASALAVLPGGKIVVAGTTEVDDDSGTSWFSLVRYTPNGSVDPAFGSAGIVKTVFVDGGDQLGGIVALPSGEIVASGAGTGLSHGLEAEATVLARYSHDGSLDPGFGTGGKVITPPHYWQPGYYGGAPALQDRKIIVAGSRIARFTASGRLDRTFGESGFATFGSVQYLLNRPVVVEADGKILTVVGSSVIRLTPDGQPDKNFGAGGVARLGSSASSLALQADGKILAGGRGGSSWKLTRRIGGTTDCFVPRVHGETIADATVALREANCTRGPIGYYPSSTVPSGRVIYTVPARWTERPRGYAVELVVSEGKAS